MNTEEERDTLTKILKALVAIAMNELFNSYAIENVVFGELKPKDEIPFDRFVEELNLRDSRPYSVRESIEGIAITEDETIVDKEIVFFKKECFISHMNDIFAGMPFYERKDNDENGLYPFKKKGLNDYIMRLFPLFEDILATEAEHNFYDLLSPLQTGYYEKIAKFLVAIIKRGLRQGCCVNRYVKGLPYLPYYVKRLLKEKKGRFLLANNDPESLDFRLALLSSIRFMSAEHSRLFELKARKWAGDL